MELHRCDPIKLLFISSLLLIYWTINGHANNDQFDEHLFVKPLDDGQLLVQFRFRTLYRNSLANLTWENKFQLFPLPVAQLVADFQLAGMHLSLTRGNWNYDQWGYSSSASPPGAQLWAKFRQYHDDPQRAWHRLVSALSGRFCASLSSIDNKSTSHPRYSFRPIHTQDESTPESDSPIYYGNYVDEPLCTENLTPWRKLLPCSDKSGLASLLQAEHLFKSTYSSIAIDIGRPSHDSSLDQVELSQTMTIVVNAVRLFDGKQSWSLAKLFGTQLKRNCHLATSSDITIETTYIDEKVAIISPKSYQTIEVPDTASNGKAESTGRKSYAKYDTRQLLDNARFANKTQANVGVRYHNFHKYMAHSTRPSLSFSTHIAGVGTFDGTIVATIRNSYPEPITVFYYDVIPDFLRVFSHTLCLRHINGGNQVINPEKYEYVPSRERERAAQIELQFTIPTHGIVEVSYDFERVFLRWNEYRPDANRGILLGSAVLSATVPYVSEQFLEDPAVPISSLSKFNSTENTSWIEIKLYARPLLVVMPTPDFSMPYNVLCLVTTVMVAAFGPLHGLTTRRPDVQAEKKEKIQDEKDEDKRNSDEEESSEESE